ncbi:GrpB family protein [Actinoplanes sp. M2I2]|uniref:GrpB family protein n=1 Tax=Actinoplanes sp. M2I2 TaxID=1734444 RepID=UPI00201FEE2F|nr:GrpB family protein [Actinoplanes sp. M2I2]
MTGSAVQVVDYDPTWPARARSAAAELRSALRDALSEIEHIGSTAVPGLAAKPVIDLLAAADHLEPVRDYLRCHPKEAERYALSWRVMA